MPFWTRPEPHDAEDGSNMIGLRIRDARRYDSEGIGLLWRELMLYHRALDPRFDYTPEAEHRFIRHAQDMMRSRDARVLVAEETASGQLVGFLMGEMQTRHVSPVPGAYGFIGDAFVREEWRQRGVGTALFEEVRRWFVARKALAIELYVAEANPVGQAFWQTMGLEPYLKMLHLDL